MSVFADKLTHAGLCCPRRERIEERATEQDMRRISFFLSSATSPLPRPLLQEGEY